MKSYMQKKEDTNKQWILIDAKGEVLGRLATKIATILMGKHKPTYTPHVDCGDNVIVINAKEVVVSGNKREDKVYRHYTGYPGGMREYNFETLMAKKPEEIIKRAVRRMMPNNNLRNKRMKHLRVFADASHNMQAQNPVVLEKK